MKHTIKTGAAAFGIALLVLAGAPLSANAANGSAATGQHYDLTLTLTECGVVDGPGWLGEIVAPLDWEFAVVEHDTGEVLAPEDYIVYTDNFSIAGFAVKFDSTCVTENTDPGGNPVPYPGVDTFTFAVQDGEVSATPSLVTVDHGDYHQDVSWSFPGDGDYSVNVAVTGSIWDYGVGTLNFQKIS